MKLGKIKIGLLFLFVLGLLVLPSKDAQAANPGKVTLKVNKAYKSYDITGDKKKDTIIIKGSKDQYGTYQNISIRVNGKQCASWKNTDAYVIEAKLYTLKNGKPFLYLWFQGDNDDGIGGVFQYKSGKFKQIIDPNTFFGKKYQYAFHFNATVKKVKGNTMTVQYYLMSNTLAGSTYTYDYTYKGGTLKRTSSQTSKITCFAGNTLTAQVSMKVYKNPDGKKTAFTLKPGKRIKLLGAYVKSGKFYIKVKGLSNKKTGWIKCYKEYPRKQPFQEIMYAG